MDNEQESGRIQVGAAASAFPKCNPETNKELQMSLCRLIGEEKVELTVEGLKTILESLGPYSSTIDENGRQLLKYISDHFQQCLPWVATTVTVPATAIRFLNIIRYFYQQLKRATAQESGNVGSGELHILLVGEGSFNDQRRPADWLVPGDSITDTILYCPWNCNIDGTVAYGIATGDIQPHHRVFMGLQGQHLFPDRWNSMRDQGLQTVPEIILSPTADWESPLTPSADCLKLYSRRLFIPYPPGGDVANWLPELPLYKIIGVIQILLKIIPPHRATVHLAAGLEYRGATQPDVKLLEEQYAYTPQGTLMTTQGMKDNPREFPLKLLLHAMFHPTPSSVNPCSV